MRIGIQVDCTHFRGGSPSPQEAAMNTTCHCPPQAAGATCNNTPSNEARCPTNQQIGKVVDTITLKSLLALPLNVLRSTEYRFCRAPNCPTVYYSSDGSQVFQENDLREKVYQKHQQDVTSFICYCFQHTIESIRTEIEQTGTSTVTEQIKQAIQVGLCACDIRNPQGSCCLGNIRQVIRSMKGEIGLR
jgi:hypothetical protein